MTGMDLTQPERTTPEEWASWRNSEAAREYPLLTYELFYENGRADVVKRLRLELREMNTLAYKGPASLMFLHEYATRLNEAGTLDHVRHPEEDGVPKDMVVATLALAFLHVPSYAMHSFAQVLRDRLARYEEREPERALFPPEWVVDPEAFASGLDFSSSELDAGELAKLEAWYERVAGEVPRSVRYLAEFNPRLLKTWRARWETAAAKVLPKQLIPYMLLTFEVGRGQPAAIREATLLARGLGLAREEVLSATWWGMMFGGQGAIATVAESVEDIVRAWPNEAHS